MWKWTSEFWFKARWNFASGPLKSRRSSDFILFIFFLQSTQLSGTPDLFNPVVLHSRLETIFSWEDLHVCKICESTVRRTASNETHFGGKSSFIFFYLKLRLKYSALQRQNKLLGKIKVIIQHGRIVKESLVVLFCVPLVSIE